MSIVRDDTKSLQDQYRNASNLNARLALHARFSVNGYGWHRWVFDQIDLPASARVLRAGLRSRHALGEEPG